MSKKKDRLNTQWRNCPICGGKNILIWRNKKRFKKEKTYMNCNNCNKTIEVKISTEII